MSEVLHVQQSLSAAPERVFRALIDPRELEVWFAEHAEVSLDAGRFDFWVRPDQLERWIASRARVDLRAGGSWDLGWGTQGTLEVLSLDLERRLELALDIGGRTVVTWELESSGGRTRLTLVHSGFAPGSPVEGLQVGWLHFMLWLKSMVEVGGAWLPAVKEIAEPAAMLYAASQWAQMAGLEGEEGVEAEVREGGG